MERLTIPDVKIDEKTTKRAFVDGDTVRACAMEFYRRLKKIEDIIGDNYNLDHFREIVEADRDGRCVVLPFAPGDEVWVVERDETGEPDCVSGYVFVTAAPGVALVHPFIVGSGDLQDILQDCLDNTEMSSTCDIEAYSLDDCYVSRKDAEAALEGGHNGKVLKPRGFAPAD